MMRVRLHIRRCVIALFVLCLALGPTFAAGGKKAAKAPASDELYTIPFLYNGALSTVKKSGDTAIGKVIKDKFNIEFEFISMTSDAQERMNMMLAAGDYPELVRIEGLEILNKYIQAGAALPLDDYIAGSKYFKKRFSEQLPYWKMTGNGRTYNWDWLEPQQFEVGLDINDIGVRTDVLEQQAWPNLLSEDDYVAFLKKGLAANPTTNGQKTIGMVVPLAESWGMTGLFVMLEKGGDFIDTGDNMATCWNNDTQRFEDYFLNKNTQENFHFFNRLYREGLLDKECFTDFGTQVQEKLNSGRALSVWYTLWLANSANNELQKAGKANMQYINMPVRSNSQVKENKKRSIRLEITRPFDSYIITKNVRDPARLFALIDWASSEEGQVLLQSGIEGVHYTIKNGKRVPTPAFIKGMNTDPEYAEKNGFSLFSFLGAAKTFAADGQAYNLLMDPNQKDAIALTDRQREAYKKLGWKNSLEYWLKTGKSAPVGLAARVAIDPTSDLGMLNEKVTQFRAQAAAALITAKTEAEYDRLLAGFMEDYKKLEPQRVIDEYNRILGELKNKMK
jgi:putative aldouronate transport system substrate-binding protein